MLVLCAKIKTLLSCAAKLVGVHLVLRVYVWAYLVSSDRI